MKALTTETFRGIPQPTGPGGKRVQARARPRATGAEGDRSGHAGKLIAEQGELDPENPEHDYLGGHPGARLPGGHFVTRPPSWPY